LQDELTGGTNISIVDDVVSCDLTGSTNIDITDGFISTTGLATTTQLDTKQDEIGSYTDLTCKTLTTQGISVNGSCDIDTTIYFDTIVLRKEDPTLSDDFIEINEIQVWINNVNLMVQPNTSSVGYFADWEVDKEVVIPARIVDGGLGEVDLVYNNVLEDRVASSADATAMIIKEFPLTSINDIRSIVIYNRVFFQEIRALGMVLELYKMTLTY